MERGANQRKLIKKSDVFIIAGILAAAGAVLLFSFLLSPRDRVQAEIYANHVLLKTVDLSNPKETRFSLPQRPEVMFHVYADGGIRFEESDCPDKICINTGILRRPGESAVCLPNGMVLKIVRSGGNAASDDDLVQ